MKRIAALLITVILMMGTFVSCGGNKNNSTSDSKSEIAMIVDESGVDDGSFNQTAWEKIEEFSGETDRTCTYYTAKKGEKESYLKLIDKAVKKDAKLIVVSGSSFETAVFAAQTTYPKVDFLLIDGVPHDENNVYSTAENTIAVIFAEEEAGFLAGYAAVKDGYKKLGFMGGQQIPPVKRYGYGFVQGAAYACGEEEQKIELRYAYTDTFEESKEVRNLAESWYKEGTKVIFACGGAMGKSVMRAAEDKGGKTIGVDVDQSGMSDTVITSAKKGIANAVSTVLKEYGNDMFVGGIAFNYTAKNKGVALEMENAGFKKFTEEDYKKIFKKLKKGEIELKKDTEVKAITDITGDWITVVQ
ncbi:MAG: BMP family ABC transporter substrate-binding protein [Clostridiales bacterium]|nr:BMP family ABC transporter substrate-binding protein [Clostridiales bacterium]